MINFSLITLCFFDFLPFLSHSYRTKVFSSAVVSFLPDLKLHNSVTVKKETKKGEDFANIYVFDYTPKQKPDAIGYIKMFLGHKLPGIVRVIHIKKSTEESLIEDWHKLAMENPDYKKCLTKFGDKRVNNIVEKWDASFNVYSHNCRHFSDYFSTEIGRINDL